MKSGTLLITLILLLMPINLFAQEKSAAGQAEIYCQKGDDALVVRKYDQAIALYSKSLQMDIRYPEAYFKRGICYVKTEQYASAIDDFNNFLKWADNSYTNKDSVRSIIISLGGIPVN